MTPYERIAMVTGCRTLSSLSKALGVGRSAVWAAKRRGSIPATWLLTILRFYGTNPDWILSGREPVYLRSIWRTPGDRRFGLPERMKGAGPMSERTLLLDILDCFPTSELAVELKRRGCKVTGCPPGRGG